MALAVLVGLPGVGKSTVGHAAAQALGAPFLDLDVVIAQQVGLASAADVIAARGVAAFREIEANCLLDVLATSAIVATGGGVVERFANRQVLRQHGKVLWLDCADEEILPRVAGSDRPLLAGAPAESLAALRRAREMLYLEIATTRLDAAGNLADVVDSVITAMSGWAS